MDELLDNAPCGYLTLADDGTILQANATLGKLLGYVPGELTGRHIESLLPVGGRLFYQTHLFLLLKLRGRVDEIYLSLRSKQGEEMPVLLNAVRREHAGTFSSDCIFVPMRQRNRYEDEILQAKKVAEEASRAAARANAELEQARAALEAQQTELREMNARLSRELREIARLQEREHKIAERLQGALRPALPGKIPGLDVAEHYRPALTEATVGGDFFDVFTLKKGCLALVVADLSGKGLAAAAQTATVRHMLRTLLYQHQATMAEAFMRLNDLLTEHDLLAGFATLFAGAYDVGRRTLSYVNAGQEPGLLWRAAAPNAPGGQIEELGPTGPVLGGYPGASYGERRVSLACGDVLALFTDGLTEAGPTRKDLLEVPGVVNLLAQSAPVASTAVEVVSHLMAGVEAFATLGGIRDDVCLLVARVEEHGS